MSQSTVKENATAQDPWHLMPGPEVLARLNSTPTGLATGEAESRGDGLQALLTGLGLFAGFALFFEGVVGISGDRIPGLEDALPFLVIALGVVILGAAFWNPRGRLRA